MRSLIARRQNGFSLVELMVGLVVAMIATVIVLKMFSDAESAKRNVSSGGDAQSNGAIALFSLSRELRYAGYGMTASSVLGCSLQTYNSARSPSSLAINSLAPVTIFASGTTATVSSGVVLPSGDTDTDIVMLVSGNANTAAEAVSFNNLIDNESYAGYVVKNRVGFQVGDLAIASESGKDCVLMQVSALPGSATVCNESVAGNASVVQFSTDSFLNPYSSCAATTSPYNLATIPVTYSSSDYTAKLSNMGNSPKIVAYAVRNHALTYCNLLTTDCTNTSNWSKLASNIVGFKAEYGWDTSTTVDGYVDDFGESTPAALAAKTDQCRISRIAAVRIGIVARNTTAHKPTTEQPTVTTEAPTWQGGTFSLSADSDWQLFRYKVFESVIPLRNIVWKGVISGC